MIATDPAAASIVVASIAAIASIATTGLALMNRRSLNTGNGHTIGQATARLEDMAWKHENRLDAIEVQIQEGRDEIEVVRKLTDAHLTEVTPMIGDFKLIRDHYYELLPKDPE